MRRTILVTGANGNLGQVVVNKFHQSGNQIIAVLGPGDIPDSFKKWTRSQQTVNLMDESETTEYIQNTVKSFPDLSAAILITGGFAMGDFDTTDESQIDRQINLNFKTGFFVVKPLLEYFKKNGGGHFILIGAKPALIPSAGRSMIAYALSKSLVIHLAELINAEGKKHGITASVIVPSVIDTPPNRNAMPNADFLKWVKPEAIAKTMQFILSESGSNLRETVFKMYNES